MNFFSLFLILCIALLGGCKEGDKSSNNSDSKPSPYISRVIDYKPAPGQYTNTLPEYNAGDSKQDILKKVKSSIVGVANGSAVTLGGWGGYITFGFDHRVENRAGLRDLRIYGNCFGGSSEAGVVMVSMDSNENGVADDEWFEIAGSAHNDATTISDYEITYYAPLSDDAVPYIIWRDNQGAKGSIEKNNFHTQSYFAEWIDADSISFKGTRLPDIAINTGSDEAPNWVVSGFEWGYADNAPNADDASAIDIAWAIDSTGQSVDLEGIDFVRIYSGVHQAAGWLGEVSTEICGAEDLHLTEIEIVQ